MANKNESMFSGEAARRQKEQKNLEEQMTNTNTDPKNNPESNNIDNKKNKRVTLNITLPQTHKIKLKEIALKRNLSASIVVQSWIEEHWES